MRLLALWLILWLISTVAAMAGAGLRRERGAARSARGPAIGVSTIEQQALSAAQSWREIGVLEVQIGRVVALQQRRDVILGVEPLDGRRAEAVDAPQTGAGFLKGGYPAWVGPGLFGGNEDLDASLVETQRTTLYADYGRATVQVGFAPASDFGKVLTAVGRAEQRQFTASGTQGQPATAVASVAVAPDKEQAAVVRVARAIAAAEPESICVFSWFDKDTALLLIDQPRAEAD